MVEGINIAPSSGTKILVNAVRQKMIRFCWMQFSIADMISSFYAWIGSRHGSLQIVYRDLNSDSLVHQYSRAH
jgi:hypothetical protein